jgi:hypothetical protein
MTRLSFQLPLLMLVAWLMAGATPSNRVLADEAECGEYGTSVTFAESPADAAKQALKKEKLVFVLHVSGLFEDSDYT